MIGGNERTPYTFLDGDDRDLDGALTAARSGRAVRDSLQYVLCLTYVMHHSSIPPPPQEQACENGNTLYHSILHLMSNHDCIDG
jgi:hypothetical protein